MIIKFDEIMNGYSENGMKLFGKYLSDYIACFYVDFENLDRAVLLEKLCDYIMAFEYRSRKRDDQIPDLFVDEMLPLIDKVVKTPKKGEAPCRAYRYAERAHEIRDRIKKKESASIMEDLEDFTKILLCVCDQYLKQNHDRVETIDFKIRSIGFDYIRSDLIKGKRFKFLKSNSNDGEGLIYNVLSVNEKNNIYNTRNFAIMILSLFYIRLTDLEGC